METVYSGYKELMLEDNEIAEIYEGKNNYNILINQYIILKNSKNEVIDKLRWTGECFKHISFIKSKERPKDFKPKTIKQEFLCDLLATSDIPIKIIGGCAGSGKTFICLKYAFHYLYKDIFDSIFVVRHNVSVGEKNGLLPGDKIAKIMGWMGFFEDNLNGEKYTIEGMISKGKLILDSVEYMKGRDIKKSFILIDEAEDLTVEQFKMIGERVSADSVICFVGDYDQVTNDKFKSNSGLKRAISTLQNNSKVGIIVFDDIQNDNVRSDTSKIFSYIY